jgi:hypothetical protein
MWNVALTAAEVMSLKRGTDATTIQPGSIVIYYPLNTGTLSTTGPALTNNGATTNVSYFSGIKGGLELGVNNLAATTLYTWSMSGGLILGTNNTTVINDIEFASTMSMSDTGPEPAPYLRNNLSLSSALSLPLSYGPLATSFGLRSRFRAAVGGEIANGRSKGRTAR